MCFGCLGRSTVTGSVVINEVPKSMGGGFPLPKIAGQDYGLKGLGGYLQPAGPMRQLAGLAAIPRKGDGMAGKRDLDPGASPLHFFGAEVRRSREAAGMTLAAVVLGGAG